MLRLGFIKINIESDSMAFRPAATAPETMDT